jgi:hypothetical protein
LQAPWANLAAFSGSLGWRTTVVGDQSKERLVKELIVFVIAAICASGVWADVSVVREWQPEPGRAGEMYAAAVEAQAIRQKLGARVWIGTDQNGDMQYVLSFADWPA